MIERITADTPEGVFTCLRYRCTMTAEDCLKRKTSFEFSGCLRCTQGTYMRDKFGAIKGMIDPDTYMRRMKHVIKDSRL